MTLLRTHIAGIPHRKPSALPPVGTILRLQPEPTNAYDPNAIQILWDTGEFLNENTGVMEKSVIFLGYVPKTETATVRQFGWTELKVVETNGPKWKEVIVENIEEVPNAN
jgi:hypothetical protein